MSMHPKGRIPKREKQVQVDLKQADTIKCNDCNNYLFITSFILKKPSPLRTSAIHAISASEIKSVITINNLFVNLGKLSK